MREFDESFRYEDMDAEFLPELFKALGYTTPVNKNIFNPVGAPHTWPTCLTLMYWLAQLVKYRRSEVEAGEKRKDLFEENLLAEELIVAAFNDNPDEEWFDESSFDHMMQAQIDQEKGELTRL